jgi:hypothetical protein
MGNMQVLPIIAITNGSWKFIPNMQYPHMKTMPFVIKMNFIFFEFCFASFRLIL